MFQHIVVDQVTISTQVCVVPPREDLMPVKSGGNVDGGVCRALYTVANVVEAMLYMPQAVFSRHKIR